MAKNVYNKFYYRGKCSNSIVEQFSFPEHACASDIVLGGNVLMLKQLFSNALPALA
jgi:hypothetical protein